MNQEKENIDPSASPVESSADLPLTLEKIVPEKKATSYLVRKPEDPVIRVPEPEFDTSARKFELEPQPQPQPQPETSQAPAYEYLGELPESYGTKILYLTARDPEWVFAYWDLTREQVISAEQHAHDGKVFLQLYREGGERVQQIQVGPWAKEWCLQVNQPKTRFYAEVGYYRHDGGFEVLTRSGICATPADSLSARTDAQFVTIPMHLSFKELFDLISGHLLPGEDLAEALARLQREGFPFPFDVGATPQISEEAQRSVIEYMGGDIIRRIPSGSGEIVEILRRRLQSDTSSGQWISSLSSPFGASFGVPRDFFMHVNAELIIYGGTDPKARVRIAGQDIKLQPDGTFSYHFNFADGKSHIPISATSPDGAETRSAMLSFLRLSDYVGEVKDTPQPPRSQPFGHAE